MKFALLITSFLFFQITFAQTVNLREDFQSKSDIDLYITKQLKQSKTIGLSAALIDSSGTIWSKSYGYNDKANEIFADSKTIYCIGSISKTFTGIAIMQLHEAGKLDINKPVTEYIKDFKPLGADSFINEITIKSLLTHHSGLPSDNWAMMFTDKNYFCTQEVVDYFNNHYVCNKPNNILSYSNIGYALLGVIIERVSDEVFHEYIAKHITEPLGMKNSSFVLEEHMKKNYSKQYLKNGQEFSELPIGVRPAGAFLSNIEDMSLYAQMLLQNGSLNDIQILKKETFKSMLAIQNNEIKRDYDMHMGLTWFINLDGSWFNAGGSYGHGGDTRVFHSILTIVPKQNLATVVIANSEYSQKAVSNAGRQILDKALEIKGIDTTTFTPVAVSKPKKKAFLQTENAYTFSGQYAFTQQTIKIQAKAKKVVAKIGPISVVGKQLKDSSYSAKIRVLGISFKSKEISKFWFDIVEGDTILVINSWDRDFFLASKSSISSIQSINSWDQNLGTYTQTNQDGVFKTITIEKKKNCIYLKSAFFTQKFKMQLSPLDSNNAISSGIGRGCGDRITITQEEGKTYLNYAGLRLIKSEE